MKKNCTKCKKKYIIQDTDMNPKTHIPYNFCGKCREKNREYNQNKKQKIIEKSIIKNKKFCMRCQKEFTTNGTNCKNCSIYMSEHKSLKRYIAKKMTTNNEKYCTKCSNKMDLEIKFRTCQRCRDIDKISYYKNK